MRRRATQLSALSGTSKRLIMLGYDGAALLVALWLAFSIRLGVFFWPADQRIILLWFGAALAGVVLLERLGTYRMVIRYLDVRAAPRLALGAAGAAAIWFAIAYLSRIDMPRSVGFIYFGIAFSLMFYARVLASKMLSGPALHTNPHTSVATAKPIGVVIYGANAAGFSLAESILRQPRYKLRFFIDDNKALVGRTIVGQPIRAPAELREFARGGAVEEVFLALPQATRPERMAALAQLSGLALRVMTIPSHDEIMRGRFTLSDVRPLKVEDLLKRDVVPPLDHLLREGIEDRSILVTGAGGSIGSEICRQIIRCAPRRIVMFDHSEYLLYRIEMELQSLIADDPERDWPEVVPVIGTLLNEKLLAKTLRCWSIDTVFHAAAYKHVPLLEDNEVVGIENNVIGTKTLADACVAHGVRRLTMISTDKAVRPTNIMGSSKRIAELYIQALAHEPGNEIRFGIVRFGNVLDSSGSVVQQFRSQIRDGGPVTVTHPDITRFFMSIPEATQLVLQAGSLAMNGEVFVLDMGEPLRIVDLARTMISLSGMTERTSSAPFGDIEISYMGLRPGEKLHEELFIGDAISETEHPQIKKADEPTLSLSDLQWALHRLQTAVKEVDAKAIRAIVGELLKIDERRAA